MTINEILTALQNKFPAGKLELQKGQTGDSWILVSVSDIVQVLEYLKNGLGCAYMACLSGVDYQSSLGVVYVVRSLTEKFEVMLKVQTPRENPVVPSVAKLYAIAGWFEREAYDLVGINFEGHPDLRRIMMPDDWIGHPLRKDYREPAEYHGIPTDRPDTRRLFDPDKPATPNQTSTGQEGKPEAATPTPTTAAANKEPTEEKKS
jgi:NADH-quinone oxidoreductase subunit C